MKIVVYFILYVFISVLIVFLNSFLLNSALAQFVYGERLYHIKYIIWRLLPILLQISLLMLSLHFTKKLFFGVYRRITVLGLHVAVFVLISIWAWTHGEQIRYWETKQFSLMSLRSVDLNEVKIYNNFDGRKTSEGKDNWIVTWKNNYGDFNEILIRDGTGYKYEYNNSLEFGNNLDSNTINVQSDSSEMYSETLSTFLNTDSFRKIYSNQILRYLLYFCIGILFSINVLLLGLFETQRDTILSIILMCTIVSIIFLLLLSYPMYIFISTALLYAIILGINIKKIVQEKEQGL